MLTLCRVLVWIDLIIKYLVSISSFVAWILIRENLRPRLEARSFAQGRQLNARRQVECPLTHRFILQL